MEGSSTAEQETPLFQACAYPRYNTPIDTCPSPSEEQPSLPATPAPQSHRQSSLCPHKSAAACETRLCIRRESTPPSRTRYQLCRTFKILVQDISACNICPTCEDNCSICSSSRFGLTTSANAPSPTTLIPHISCPFSVLAASYFNRLLRIKTRARTNRKFTFSWSVSSARRSKNAISISSSTNKCFFSSGLGSLVRQ